MGCVATSKASMVVTASMAAVEAMKDQIGLCRWNHAMRSLYHRAASNRTGSLSSQARKTTSASNSFSSSSDSCVNGGGEVLREKRSEEKLQNAYQLICWGPN